MRTKRYTLIVICTLAIIAAACSQTDRYGSTGPTSTGAPVQAFSTNAPGGVVVAVPDSAGVQCPSSAPSYWIESDLPKGDHVSMKWGHNGRAVQIEWSFKRRDDNRPAIIVKPNEHVNAAGVFHSAEAKLQTGIYEGSVRWVYPSDCGADQFSRSATFTINHGVESLPNINPPKPTVG